MTDVSKLIGHLRNNTHSRAFKLEAADALAAQTAEIERLREVSEQHERALASFRADLSCHAGDAGSSCEQCAAPLFAGDDYVSDTDGVAGCWHAMTDVPSERERPCFAYRTGRQDARAFLQQEHQTT